VYVITFYSFKGGVGRTLALVNVAAQLARMGRKVLLVDFDLEAPGLETFERLRPPQPQRGVVEYVKEYLSTKQSPDVREYIYSVGTVGKKGGQLWVMPAGRRDAKYQATLTYLDWKRLYKECQGYWFFEDTKQQWKEAYEPDYVLIDSRTGHTDVEGICTRQLPDAVVVLFFPNEQNLVGLKDVCARIRGEETSGLKKKIHLHFVMSNVPALDDEQRFLRRRVEKFRKELAIPPGEPLVIHRHESLRMLEQPVFVLQRRHSRLAQEYRRLVRFLIRCNLADREGALECLRRRQDEERRLSGRGFGNLGKRLENRRQDAPTLNAMREHFSGDAEVLLEIARYHQRGGQMDSAMRLLDRVLELQPDRPDLLFERAVYRQKRGDRTEAAADLLRYLRVSDSAVAIDPREVVPLLLEVSLATFLDALSLPSVRAGWLGGSKRGLWLHFVAQILIRQRRWGDAVRYLEATANELIGEVCSQESEDAAYAQSWRACYLAMAYWGKTGTLRADLCRRALAHLLPPGIQEDSEDVEGADYQCLALLYWGVADSQKAVACLNRAVARLEEEGNSLYLDPLAYPVSYWTFTEAPSPLEFRDDCKEIRRLIQGESIRPPFLGEPAALN
jgi:MinD-like ATPase involved in chromosome partitioning or flagellar assembly